MTLTVNINGVTVKCAFLQVSKSLFLVNFPGNYCSWSYKLVLGVHSVLYKYVFVDTIEELLGNYPPKIGFWESHEKNWGICNFSLYHIIYITSISRLLWYIMNSH